MLRTNRGRARFLLASAILILLAIMLLVPRWSGQQSASASLGNAPQAETTDADADTDAVVVAMVDGAPVTLKEFKARMPEQRAEAITYFQQTYGCNPGEAGFWSVPCGEGGQLPLQRLKEMTLRRLIEDRVRELLANTAGLEAAVGYDAFLADWEEENRERAKRIANGKVIYGPRQYSEAAYYRYVVSTTVLGLKQWLAEQDGPPREERLRQEYAAAIAGQSEPPSFEQARDAMIQRWSDKRYGSWFAEQVSQAVVEVDQQVYEGIGRNLLIP